MMQPMYSRVLWLVAGVLFASLAMSPVVLIAQNSTSRTPSVVATVNLETIFNNLDEKVAADDRLQQYADELQAQQDQTRDQIARMEEEIGGLAPGTTAYQEKFRELAKKSVEYQAQVELNRSRLDKQKGFTLREIYLNIKAEAHSMSQEFGIDIVMLDDSVVDLDIGSEADVSRQISARRTLYCNPQLDVTQDLIDRMNRTFQQP